MQDTPVVLYASETALEGTAKTLPWADLAELLTTHDRTPCTLSTCTGAKCPHKFGVAWSPVIQVPEDERETGPRGATRLDVNVDYMTALVLDADHLDDNDFRTIAEKIEPYQYIVHTTHNDREGSRSLRVVIPLDPHVPAEIWKEHVYPAIVQHLGLGGLVDRVCRNSSRLYFMPTCPGDAEPIAEVNTGKSIDYETIPRATAPTPIITPIVNTPDTSTPLSGLWERIRELKASYARSGNTEGYRHLDALVTRAPLSREHLGDADMNALMSILATALPANTPFDAIVVLITPSLHALCARADQSPWSCRCGHSAAGPHWLARAADTYERAMTRRLAADAARVDMNAQLTATFANILAARAPADGTTSPVTDGTADAVADGMASDSAPVTSDSNPNAWMAALLMTVDGNGDPKAVKSCGSNAALILAESKDTKGTIRFNALTKSIEVTGGPFATENPTTLDVAVSNYLMTEYGIALSVHDTGMQLLRVARQNEYDPLQDYLRSCARAWDGVARLDNFFVDHLQAMTTDIDGSDIADHVKRISGKWFISAVARAMNPGVKVDTVLILEGLQGIKKSTAIDALGGAFFTDSGITIGDKDSKMLAARSWLIELPELASFKRAESQVMKSFLSARIDLFRPPFGRMIEEFPRRCVFVGTTNDDAYLTDQTGNRRYWTVRCDGRIDVDAIRAVRDQLWAEAMVRYNAGEKWYFENVEHEEAANRSTGQRMESSILGEKLLAAWMALSERARGPMTTLEVAEKLLGVTDVAGMRHGTKMEIGHAMRAMGFKHRRVRRGAVLEWTYLPTDDLLAMPVVSPTRVDYLQTISTAKAR